ncbi:hypothetical protein NDU88_005835 [Pleurodeles waltl]|uniref:Uncharacterized protein n=1 Tax=Pleurodeles waltl TaxID=8319 RepID=A0AAV7NNL5_PLEWA|nr:hypothetical protein NDU88_005835 [Pleurodeles waltl]
MDQFTTWQAGDGSQRTIGGEVSDPSGAQILAAIEASGQAIQTQIATIADLHAVSERSVATEIQTAAAFPASSPMDISSSEENQLPSQSNSNYGPRPNAPPLYAQTFSVAGEKPPPYVP